MNEQERNSWRGIYAACFTPLASDEQLDTAAMESLVANLLAEGLRGMYVTGSTGEGYALEDSVRCAAFRTVAAAGRAKDARVIAHIGGVPTRRMLAMARAAADAGCHAVAAIPPYGGTYTYDELTSYYVALTKESPLPVLVYHIPDASGYNFNREQLSRWLEMPKIEGMKYSSTDMSVMERLCALHPDKLIFHGPDMLLMHGLSNGANAAIGATYNLTGPIALKILSAIERKDLASARKGQGALNSFIEAKNAHGNMRTMKALVAKRNKWKSAASPLPAAAANPEKVALVERVLEESLAIARQLP
jgi:N-acetylneuraminate lyase